MDAESITTILREAIRFILDETGFKDVTIRPVTGKSKSSDLVVTTGITGNIKGILMVSFGSSDAVRAANTMLAHIGEAQSGSTLDENHKASLSEITNLFTARFVNILSARDIDCNLTPPTIITGSSIGVSIRNIEHTIELEADGGAWRFYISLYIINTPKN
jgi:CheY-specific phosphatase CheX